MLCHVASSPVATRTAPPGLVGGDCAQAKRDAVGRAVAPAASALAYGLVDEPITPRRFASSSRRLSLSGLAGERAAGVGDCGARILSLVQHDVRAHQLYPAVDVGAILAQACSETIHHAADHFFPLLRRSVGDGAGGIIRARFANQACRRFDARQSGLHQRAPRSPGRRVRQQLAPDTRSFILAAVLLRRKTDVKPCRYVGAIEAE